MPVREITEQEVPNVPGRKIEYYQAALMPILSIPHRRSLRQNKMKMLERQPWTAL